MSKKPKRSGTKGPGKPKKKCCLSTPRCTRCPLRMLAEGTLPPGYTVRRRTLIKPATRPEGKPDERTKGKDNRTKAKGKGKDKRKKGKGKRKNGA